MKFICLTDTRHWWQKFLHPADWIEVGRAINSALSAAHSDKTGKTEPGVILKDMEVKIIEADV